MTSRYRMVGLIAAVAVAFQASAADGSRSAAPLPKASTTISTIAFGSCADEEKPQPIWDKIAADNPDLFLFIGDNVYADINRGEFLSEPSEDELNYSYGLMQKHPDFQRFQRKYPILATWDDHDFGKNDAGAEFDLKWHAKGLMIETFGLPQDKRVASREGVYHSAIYGPPGKRLQIIMLDTRWFRSALTVTDERGAKGRERYLPSSDPNQSMLGEAQWQWLENELKKPADLRLLVSSIQVLADGHGWEAWRTMPQERARLYDLLRDTGADKTIILSGDRHVAGFYKNASVLEYELYEFTSSSLNLSFNPGPVEETGPNQVGDLFGPENYGLISVDWDKGIVDLDLKDNGGKTVQNVSIALKELHISNSH